MVVPPGKAAGKARWQDVCGFVGMFSRFFWECLELGLAGWEPRAPSSFPGMKHKLGCGEVGMEREPCACGLNYYFFFSS